MSIEKLLGYHVYIYLDARAIMEAGYTLHKM